MRGTLGYALLVAGFLSACTEEDKPSFGRGNEGDACKRISDCRPGLGCTDKKCVALPPLSSGPQPGDACSSDDDCTPLFCGRQDVCTSAAPRADGESCGLTEDCQAPLICRGFSNAGGVPSFGVCGADDDSAGTYDLAEECEAPTDCRAPFVCGLDDTCTRLPFFSGPDCSRSDQEAGAFRAYFEVPPQDSDTVTEFYRLPFPSDVRVRDGRIDLGGHPAPQDVLGMDLRDTYFRAVEEDVDGFAVNAPVFFRFTDPIDTTTLCLDPGGVYPAVAEGEPGFCAAAGEPNLYLVNVDPDSAEYGLRRPLQLGYGSKRGQYICQNWLAVAPRDGEPLLQGTTYAVVLERTILSRFFDAPIADRDFAAILAGSPASDAPAELVAAHAAMAPLRDWLAQSGVASNALASATVFTTGTPSAIAASLRERVAEAALGTFGDTAVCDLGQSSPCDDGFTDIRHQRGCFGPRTGFDEIHGIYSAPYYQQGTRPYRNASDGGAFALDVDGLPTEQGTEAMCFALAVPETPAPPGGWPVVLYAHGTGGSFRSFIDDGTAELLTAEGFAVISFENVLHGSRQGPDPEAWELDPGQVFFNILNPRASRDNVLQGAADLFYLTRMVQARDVTCSAGTISFDASSIFFFGHSQGTVIAPAFLAAEPELDAAVLSGAGAELPLTILNKQSPINLATAVGTIFGDRALSRTHPMMGILSLIFAPADAIAYAPSWVLTPSARPAPLPLLQTFGVGDTFTPDATQISLARAAGLPFVGVAPALPDGASLVSSPASNNVNGTTAGVVQFEPNGYDGHFVAFQEPDAQESVRRFLESALGGAPTIER